MATASTKELDASQAVPSSSVKGLTELYGGGPPGRFLRGRHGITHFRLQEPAPSPQRARIAVLSHGLGTQLGIWDGPVTSGLLASGFRVLSYDFYGHGWSVAGDTWLHYDKATFLSQLSELLDHVLLPQEPVDLFVGHSTGGLVAVLAAASFERPFRELALISPAFWAVKDAVARLGDRVPETVFALTKRVGLVQKLMRNSYAELIDKAFGVVSGVYICPESHREASADVVRMFELHPQVLGGIVGIVAFFLREDLLQQWRTELRQLLAKGKVSRVQLLWGKFDIVVPFRYATEVVALSPDRVQLNEFYAGHELPKEDPEKLTKALLSFAAVPSRM